MITKEAVLGRAMLWEPFREPVAPGAELIKRSRPAFGAVAGPRD